MTPATDNTLTQMAGRDLKACSALDGDEAVVESEDARA
jgi:hypothetical protein